MDDQVHGRLAAVYATERKPLSPSFYVGLAVALALHAGAAYYVVQLRFAQVPAGALQAAEPDKPTIVTIERLEKQKPIPQTTVRVHDSPAPPVADSPPIAPNPGPDILTKPEVPPVLPLVPSAPGGTNITDPGPAEIVAARWTRFPDGDALADYYPPRAANAEVEGQATVQCTVLDSAGRVACIVISETPGGWGFGAATVRMVQDKGRVDTSQGGVAKGSLLRQTVAWRLN